MRGKQEACRGTTLMVKGRPCDCLSVQGAWHRQGGAIRKIGVQGVRTLLSPLAQQSKPPRQEGGGLAPTAKAAGPQPGEAAEGQVPVVQARCPGSWAALGGSFIAPAAKLPKGKALGGR